MIWTIIIAAVTGSGAGIALWCWAACRVGHAADDAIDADFEPVHERTARLARGGEVDLHV